MLLLIVSLLAYNTGIPQASHASVSLILYKPVTLPEGEISFKTIFDSIRAATGLPVYYKHGTLNPKQKIRIKAIKMAYQKVLNYILAGTGLGYTPIGNTIFIFRKKINVTPVNLEVPLTVIDDHHIAIPEATLKSQSTGDMINTGPDGIGIIRIVQLPDTIFCFAPNRQTDTIILISNEPRTISMRPKNLLNEAIVTGYATGTRRTYTGDRTLVDRRQIDDAPVSNILETLTGRVSGLLITQTSGVHGASVNLSLRGKASILNGQDPLYLIDGVPFAPANQSVSNITSGNSAGSLNPFSFMSKEDVESIEILKDADATAIYGSKGANGVIIITTKHGMPAKHMLNVSLSTGVRQVTKRPTLMNMREYTAMRIEALTNDMLPLDSTRAPELLRWDTTRSIDWGKWLIGGLGHSTTFGASLTGGSDATNYYLGIHQLHETDVFPTNPSHNQITTSGNLNHRSADGRLNVHVNSMLGIDNNHQFIQDPTRLQLLVPNAPPLVGKDGLPVFRTAGLSIYNPVSAIKNPYSAQSRNFLADLDATYQPCSSFSVKTNLGYNSVRSNERSEIPVWTLEKASSPGGSAYTAGTSFNSWIIEPQVEYRRRLGNLNISLLAGSTWQGQHSVMNTLSALGIYNDAQGNPASPDTFLKDHQSTDYLYKAFFSRLNIRWKDRFILNLTARKDHSTRLGPGRQYGDFGAGGFAWVFSDQSFSRRLFPFISYGKLRTSYGVTGNDMIGGGFRYFNTWAPTANQSLQNGPDTSFTGQVGPGITWETIKKMEFALDLGLLANRIFFSAAWYRHRSSNQILPDSFPRIGAAITLKNRPVVVENSGWEFTLTGRNIDTRNFGWTTSVNISIPVNRLVSFPGLAGTTFGKDLVVGQSLSSLRAYRYTGLDSNGVFTFKDKDGNGRMTDADRETVGRLDPVWFGGLENTFRWHRWRLSMLVEARVQTGINYQAAFYASNPPGSIVSGMYSNETKDMLDRWKKPGDGGQFQRLTTRTLNSAGRAITNYLSSSALLTDASFARLKSASLSYQLPPSLLRNTWMKEGTLSLQGENLFTLTPYKSVDPELQNILVLPPMRIVSLTIQTRF